MRNGDRVVVVLLSAIGDVVEAFPLLSSLKKKYPAARFEWVAHPVSAEIACRHPGVERVWQLERRPRWTAFRELCRRLSGQRFDLVIDLQVYAKASLVTSFLDSPRKLGFDPSRARELNWLVTNERLPARPMQLVCDEYLEFADHLDAPRRYEWPFVLTVEERGAQTRFLECQEAPLAALVVGTSRREKEWPPERWAALAGALHHEWGYTVGILGGRSPTEDDLVRRLREAARCPVVDLRANDVGRLAWLLDSAALVVSGDTGPYHLGVALGAPCIGLYGATDPARHGPARRCLELIVDAFHDPGEEWLPVRRRRRPGRMDRIGVRDVLAAVALARARYPHAAGTVAASSGTAPQNFLAMPHAATDPVPEAFPE